MTHWFTGSGGLRLAADLFGPEDGTPVLLMGGMGQTRHSWRRVAQHLATSGRRAIMLDIRGHGESEHSPTHDYGYAFQAADVAAVRSEIGRPMVLVGNSLGGKIGLTAAATGEPGTAAALVLVDAVPKARKEGIKNIAGSMQMSRDGFASPQEAAEQVAAERGETATADAGERLKRNMRQVASGRWFWHWDTEYFNPRQEIGEGAGSDYLVSIAPQVTVPTLLAWCELSEVVDAEGVAKLRALIPHLEVEVIPGARHMIVGDQNDVFADALMRFLDRTGL